MVFPNGIRDKKKPKRMHISYISHAQCVKYQKSREKNRQKNKKTNEECKIRRSHSHTQNKKSYWDVVLCHYHILQNS